MSTSFLPFLYPTRLVQRPLRAPVVRHFLRSLHATAPAHSRRQPPPSSSSPSSSPAPRAARRRDPIPFELPPDIERDLLPDSERLEQNGDEEDYVDDSGHINLGGVGGAEGTITPLERQAFRRIFREIAHRQQQEELDLEMYGHEGMGDDVEAGVDGDYVGEDVGVDIGIDAGDANSPEALRQRDDEQRSRVNSILGGASDDQVLARENQRNLRRQGEEEAMYALEGADAGVATDTSVLRSLGSVGGTSAAIPQAPPSPPADAKLNMQRNRVLSQFPPSLRSAAGKAFGIKDEVPARHVPGHVQEKTVAEPVTETKRVTPTETPDETTLPPPSPAVLARRRRQQKMELAMLSKKTDFALWQYMEEHVFSLVDELGIGKGKAKAQANASAPATEKKSRKVSSKLTANGPLYPALLLHGQRLLDSHFRGGTTSPLALAVLPRVKALGLASYVLGASTPLYNHLLGIRWLRQGDAPAVFALLSEMQRAGLPFDQGTLNLVKSIEWHVVPLAGGRTGTGTGLAAPSAAAQRENAFLVAALQHLPDLAAVARTAAYWRQVVERSVNWGRRA
ncbi:hypothetical protein SPBR_04188 [Sporothrix brasiliensis 5110]|uniref:Mtf2-like C-terminal domain-containing protein n=1 Tax=Sporothrix brasiliensis 5110 TaxID=1398154 RepID=A0A0C2FQL6_9PEZI|nr:uncharacterized protein SPBR_04188 [Sporothrix brasiliensis 5110]KIH93343.1 hypothetical protein SPBR_04188 [Sporothrix brasiliensis 5110]